MSPDGSGGGKGVGARLARKEDARFLRGRGEYIGDMALAGMKEVAFLRAPVAHARVRAIRKPTGFEQQVFVNADLVGVKPIRAVTSLKGFKPSDQHALVKDKVRQVGELVAMVVADTRAEAEDIAERVEVDYEELPAVHDMLKARDAGGSGCGGGSCGSTGDGGDGGDGGRGGGGD